MNYWLMPYSNHLSPPIIESKKTSTYEQTFSGHRERLISAESGVDEVDEQVDEDRKDAVGEELAPLLQQLRRLAGLWFLFGGPRRGRNKNEFSASKVESDCN